MPKIIPGIDVINTFENQKTEIQFALGEYIDNSIDSYFKNKDALKKIDKDFRPFIEITFNSNKNLIVVEDNCAGIHKEDEERAFSIGKKNPNHGDLGTYGMGMKVSSFWFCPNWKVETKPINEKYKKTYEINLEDILVSGKSKDSKVKSDADPFTKITLKNVYSGRISTDTKTLANIEKYLSEMYRFMIMDESITIRFNGKPLSYKAPEIFHRRYIDDKNGEEIRWLAHIPEFDLGTVERDGKTIELKTLGGAVYIKKKGTNKKTEQKGFSLFWKKRLVDGHPQRPWMPGTSDYDDPDLQIYGAHNQYVATRLEGYIHLSPNFQVPSTKDGVRWEGKEEILIKKLKKYLENSSLFGDKSEKKYNIIKQCKKINKIADDDPVEPIDADGIIDNFTPEDEDDVIVIPADIDDEEPEEGFFNDENKTYPVQYEGTTWEVDIKTINKTDEKLYKIVKGPFGKEGDSKRKVGLKINFGHPFYINHFPQNDLEELAEGIIKFCIALALAESIAAETHGNQAAQVRLIFNQIINSFSEHY
jgi:hypothetical protein